MTDPRPLQRVRRAHSLILFEAESTAAQQAVMGWREAGVTTRVVRGRKMRQTRRLFDEFAAALQFPSYFGENWDAFDECLADMDWLPLAGGCAIVIEDPVNVLSDEVVAELTRLVEAFDRAWQVYASPVSSGEWWDRSAVAFNVVLQCRQPESEAVAAYWRSAGASVDETAFPDTHSH